EFDFDAPLTDAAGRPMSRAMQVAERRKDLSPLPGLELLDKVDPNKKVNFTEEQLSRLSELLEIKLQEFNVKAKVVEAQPGPV
ncbi:DNA translocase FtsK, partial [Acinetobacter schindleri]